MSRFLYSNPSDQPGPRPDAYTGKRGVFTQGGFQAIVEQAYETNSRLARIEALLERIAVAAEYVPPST